jgi:dipeptidyl aminopeptidase/acylaminoacyl peptidase
MLVKRRVEVHMSRLHTVLSVAVFSVAAGLASPTAAQERRPLRVDDIFSIKDVRDPRTSPDGQWVAYTVTSMDRQKDKHDTDIYMVAMSGGEPIRLTGSDKPESKPRWSPDGRYLAFLSAREGKKTQVWLLDRRGGEAKRLTDYKADVSSLAWSPDSRRLALVVADVDPDDPDFRTAGQDDSAPKPIVVQRLQFKRDGNGYLTNLRGHVHVYDIAGNDSVQVTDGPYDDESPVWSPDGKWIAFASNRTEDPDANDNSDIFIVAAEENATPRAVVASPFSETAPAFSPDGTMLAYVLGGTPGEIWYATTNIAVSPVAGGAARTLTPGLDRNVSAPAFTADGNSVLFMLEERLSTQLARVALAGTGIERLVTGELDLDAYDTSAKGDVVVLESRPHQPPEVSVLRDGGLARLTRVNDDFLKGIELGPVETFQAKSQDDTVIDAFLTRPPRAAAGERFPTLLRIHGGPVYQFSMRFEMEWQLLASHGYAVVGANPRGSSGRGRDFSYAIWADWGNRDYADVMAAVDRAIAMGVADPDRLGVGGWSYGGILTNYVITQTTRFKAAISGASEVNYLSNYGHDHYQREWEAEFGLPWEQPERWLKASPFLNVARITTPTLLMCGEKDWNVPLINSEQMYQALRRLGRDTQLVIYPDQTHEIRRPSYQRDRYERYIDWYDKYVKWRGKSTMAAG